jgi:hypothetical protein
MNDQTEMRVSAQAAMYIDVFIGEQKQIYDIATAKALFNALGVALGAIDKALESSKGD